MFFGRIEQTINFFRDLLTFNGKLYCKSLWATGYGNAKFQTVSFLATTLGRVIQLSTGAANGDVDGWT